jgi:hypothetical protein
MIVRGRAVVAALVAFAVPAWAQPAPHPLRWRGTRLVWTHAITTQTVGIGQDVQSENPTWDMSYVVRPRYALWNDDRQAVSLRGEIGVTRELTNSDVTTRRGAWSLTDAMLFGAYLRVLHEAGEAGPAAQTADGVMAADSAPYQTVLAVRLPVLSFPTSTVSYSSGMLLGLGVTAAVAQSVPVLGLDSQWAPSADFDVSVGYSHLFTEASEPTGSGFERLRMSPEGSVVVSDQLGGAAFAAHQLTIGVDGTLYVTRRVSWSTSLGLRPSFKYGFSHAARICGNVATGCVTVGSTRDPERYALVTQFASAVGVRALRVLGLSVGYTNVTLQLGPDGRRRNLFGSPDARFELAVTLHLDELYLGATGRSGRADSGATLR